MKKGSGQVKKSNYDSVYDNPYRFVPEDDELNPTGQLALSLATSSLTKPVQFTAPAQSIPAPTEAQYAGSGNPYASLSYHDPDGDLGARGFFTNLPQVPITVSKATFIRESRRVLEQYIPAAERRQLRSHHRDFITRNAEKSPTIRAQVLNQLQRYDLSTLPGTNAQFNRERDPFTEAKLREIERLAGA